MQTYLPRVAVCVSFCLLAWSGPLAAQVALRLDHGQLAWRAGDADLGSGATWLQVRDLAAGEAFVNVPLTADGTGFRGTVAELRFEGAWKALQDAWELTCTVSAQPARDRALVVRVALPLAATGCSRSTPSGVWARRASGCSA